MSERTDFRTIDLFADLGDDALAGAVEGLETIAVLAGEEFSIVGSGAVCCVIGGGRLALGVIAEE